MTPRRVSGDWADHVPTRPEIEPTVHIERRDPGLLRECLTIINACLVVPGSVTWGGDTLAPMWQPASYAGTGTDLPPINQVGSGVRIPTGKRRGHGTETVYG